MLDPDQISALFSENFSRFGELGASLSIWKDGVEAVSLTIGVEKSTNLTTFAPFPMSAPQLSVDGQGRLRFEFTSPGNAAFFRVRAQ